LKLSCDISETGSPNCDPQEFYLRDISLILLGLSSTTIFCHQNLNKPTRREKSWDLCLSHQYPFKVSSYIIQPAIRGLYEFEYPRWFIAFWENYCPGTELPITFFVGDSDGAIPKPQSQKAGDVVSAIWQKSDMENPLSSTDLHYPAAGPCSISVMI
jgi:hypothetical protein